MKRMKTVLLGKENCKKNVQVQVLGREGIEAVKGLKRECGPLSHHFWVL